MKQLPTVEAFSVRAAEHKEKISKGESIFVIRNLKFSSVWNRFL